MNLRVAISKRRSKRLAAGVIVYYRGIKIWMVLFYGVADEQASPFGGSAHKTLKEAMAEAQEILQVGEEDWVKVPEKDVDKYVIEKTRNKWYPSKYKRVIEYDKEVRLAKDRVKVKNRRRK